MIANKQIILHLKINKITINFINKQSINDDKYEHDLFTFVDIKWITEMIKEEKRTEIKNEYRFK